jgi:hypothetical protein
MQNINSIQGVKELMNKLYNKQTYWSVYGKDILIAIIFVIIFILTISFFNIINNLQPIKKDWINQRCKPTVMPFAGIINKPSGVSRSKFTRQNFAECIGLMSNANNNFNPLKNSMNILSKALQSLIKGVMSIRDFINMIRDTIGNILSILITMLIKLIVFITEFLTNFKDILNKSFGIIDLIKKVMLGFYMSLVNLFKIIIQIVIYWLENVIVITIIFFGLSMLPLIGQVVFFPLFVIYCAIMLIILLTFLLPIYFGITRPLAIMFDIPSVPFCFSGNTNIKLKNNKTIKLKDIKLNDKFEDDSYVTTILKLSSHNQKLYKLNNIIVSGEHRVYHNRLGLITVNEHPNSISINNFREPYIYCINTSNKKITIDNTVFTDWDDMDDNEILNLHTNCKKDNILPYNFNKKDIHKYLDCGFHESTKIDLEDGRSVSIKDIEVNDILRFGEKVTGIVKIDATKIEGVYEYYLYNDLILQCSKNIEFNTLVGNIDTTNLEGNKISNVKTLYHILTDKKSFYIKGIRINDYYNNVIEKYLQKNIYHNNSIERTD